RRPPRLGPADLRQGQSTRTPGPQGARTRSGGPCVADGPPPPGGGGLGTRCLRRGQLQRGSLRHDHRRSNAFGTARGEHRLPHGPASIISDREDGILVPNRSVSGIASGLAELMGDETKRRTMAEAALKNSERFDPARVVRMHEELFEELMEAKADPGSVLFPPKQAESNVLAPHKETTVPRARSTTARTHP